MPQAKLPRIDSPGRTELEATANVLEQYGRAAFKDAASVSRGTAIGYALYAVLSANEVADASIEALEQWNGHLSVAALRAIEKGDGEVSRRGRSLSIRLPKHWA